MILAGSVSAEDAHPASITEIKAVDLGFGLPASIINMAKLAELEKPEAMAAMDPELRDLFTSLLSGSKPTSWLDSMAAQRAEDGTLFLADPGQMALWIRRNDSWVCLLSGIRIVKTFGGASPYLPVRYLGKGFFAFSQTTPAESQERDPDDFPTAEAITYLLDSATGTIIARTPAFRYDHNPPVKIAPEWHERIGVPPLPENESP